MNIIIKGSIELPPEKAKKIRKEKPPICRIEIERGKKGDMVGRLPNGKIAIIHYNNDKTVNPGEVWDCILVSEDEHKAIVLPTQIQVSSEDNLKESLELLKSQGIQTVSTISQRIEKFRKKNR